MLAKGIAGIYRGGNLQRGSVWAKIVPMSDSDANNTGPRVLIIMPAHNEAANISAAIDDLRRYIPAGDVVVVDDESGDATAEIARSKGVTVLSLACNVGVGGAMQTGYMFAVENDYDIAVQFDGDGQHRANQIAMLIEKVVANEADLVVGSRLLKGMKFRFHPLRFIGSRLLSLLVSAICRQKISDPTSGFRAAGRKMIKFFAAHYPQTYLGDTTEALTWAGRAGMKITEVSVRMSQRTGGSSAAGNITGLWLTLCIILALLVDCLEPPITEPQETPPC